MAYSQNIASIKAQADSPATDKGGKKGHSRYSQLKESTIMMVDDEPIMLEIIQALLEDEGYQHFVTVEHSPDAVEKLVEEDPDILLLDLDMPEVDGFEILKAIRANEDYRYLPVIILTASGEAENKLTALELGATDFLSKPVDPSELALRLRNTLSAKAYQDQLAYYDSLTGLPNRKLFMDRLGWSLEIARRESKPLVLMSIGLDKFRHINETLGVHVGDSILLAIAERFNEVMRSSDVIGRLDDAKRTDNMARIGGDEFAIVLSGMESVDCASKIANRVLAAIKQPLLIESDEVFITASIGISVYPDDGSDVESLLKHAASAKEFAKKQGNDNYQFYSSEMNARSREQLSMEADLRKALDNQELELYYQPKVRSEDGSLVGMECLLRWFHPERGLVSPVEFIPLAEEMGIITSIGEWVLKEACQRAKEWVSSGYSDLKISVNVSAQQFSDTRFKGTVEHALESSGLDAKHLILEITESMLMGKVDTIVRHFREIRELGVQFSIDDFGTGYSSLAYLKKFPIDELKIDRSFLTDVPASHEDSSIVKAIIAMAHTLGQAVVAEGVEELDQLRFLRQHDCDIIQGYYYSKPLNHADFSEYLSTKA